jgi:tetratricopeptide (TPR) repeat protein
MQQLLKRLRSHGLYPVAAAYAVTAWVFAQAAAIVLPSFDAPAWAMRLVIVATVLGLPMVLTLASALIQRGASRHIRYGIVAALGIVMLFSASELALQWPIALPASLRLAGAATVPAPAAYRREQNGKIEVMKFDAPSGDAELQQLSSDVGNAIVRTFTRSNMDTVSELGSRPDHNAANAELRVTGSIERQGGGMTVNSQIVDRNSGLVLVSDQDIRSTSAQSDFASTVAFHLAGTLSCMLEDRRQSRRTLSPQVLALYLNACDAITREGNMQRMMETGRRLIQAAPTLAIGHALFAIAQAQLANSFARTTTQANELRLAARKSAQLALKLDPRTPKAYLALAISYPAIGSWLQRERYMTKIWEIDPNMNPGRGPYIDLLRQVGRLQDALDVAQQLMNSADPRTFGLGQVSVALLDAQFGDVSSAREELAEIDRYFPDDVRFVRWLMASWIEEPADALSDLKSIGPKGIVPKTFACIEQYLRELPERIASHRRGLPPICDGALAERRIFMLAREGDIDGAYVLLDQTGAFNNQDMTFLFLPQMRLFRADRRFILLVRRLGLLEYWVKSGHWPDFCSDATQAYDCKEMAGQSAPKEHKG